MEKEIENKKKQMRRGVLELCVLAIIAEKEAYPRGILEKLKETKLIVFEGTLYPLLTRLRKEGKLDYEWRESLKGPPRKYYQLTDKGSTFLNALWHTWDEMVKTVNETTKNFKNNLDNE